MDGNERSGLLLALIGFALLSVGDAVVKTMAGQWSPLAVAALRFSLGATGLAGLVAMREGTGAFRPPRPWLQLARGLCLAGATLCFFSAIFIMPLAEAISLAFVAPVFTALLSRPLLGEPVRPAVWGASALALAGVLLILRPNLAELGLVAVLPLASAFFFSLTIIANRASAGSGSALSMQLYIAAIAAPVLIIAAALGAWSGMPALAVGWPEPGVIARCALVAVTATTAHWLTYRGTMRAGAASVAPMTYVQLLVATGLGWWWFGDVPDAITVVGASVIIAAGLLLWWRTARVPMPSARAH